MSSGVWRDFRLPNIAAGLSVAALILTAVVLAVVAAISNSPVLIGLVAGLVLGAFLLLVPRLALWLCVFGALIVSGVVTLFLPSLQKVTWLFSMLGFFLTAAALMQAIIDPAARARTPGFVWIGLAFMAYAVLSAPLAGSSVGELMAGSKRYLQLWGLMFAGAWLWKSAADTSRVTRFLLGLALLQLPLALYQRIVLVPQRVGMGQGVVPIDVVSGTFEASFTGGGNSSGMVLFLTMALAFVVAAWREGVLSGVRCFCLALVIAIPMGLGESKVAVLFLPAMLLVLVGRYFARAPIATLVVFVVGLAGTGLLFWIYATVFGSANITIAERVAQTIAYNFGDVGYYRAAGLNRTTVLTYWWSQHGASNPHEFMFGHGLGSSYFAPAAFVHGHLARLHGYIGIGLTAASSVLWDLGLFGLLLLLAMLGLAWRSASRLLLLAGTGWQRAGLVAARVALLLFGILLFYTDSLLNALSVQCLLMLVLGGLAMAARHWPQAGPTRRAG